MGVPADGHLALLHDFEQRALHFRRSAVDLVREQQVGEHRAERRVELARFLVVDARADEVGRHEIGRELDALELPADRLRQGLDRHRLREAWHPLHEDVTAREQRDDQPFEKVVLSDDDLLDLVEHLLHRLVTVGLHVHAESVLCSRATGRARGPRRRRS